MTREEAISRLKEGEPFSEIYDSSWNEALEVAISALSTDGEYIKKSDILNELGDTNMDILTDEVKEIVNDLPSYSFPDSAENKGEWISVSERLPEESKNYLVVIRERFNKDHWWIDICDIDTDGFAKTWNVREPYYVEAWQPLPEPYKKGE